MFCICLFLIITEPNRPTNLDFIRIAKDLLRVRWEEVDGNHAGYRVCYDPLGEVPSPIDNGLQREISLNGLRTGTEYTVTVMSYVGNGNLVLSDPYTRLQETCKYILKMCNMYFNLAESVRSRAHLL